MAAESEVHYLRIVYEVGAPAGGRWETGQSVIDQNGQIWVCSAGGTPGTWKAGPSGQGAPVVRKFPFAYNTTGLLTGATLYTPTIGDYVIASGFFITTAWNGTTPRGDFGSFVGSNLGVVAAQGIGGPWKMDQVDDSVGGTGLASNLFFNYMTAAPLAFRVTAANPIKVCVSQNGQNNGLDPGSTQGAGILYLVTATPA